MISRGRCCPASCSTSSKSMRASSAPHAVMHRHGTTCPTGSARRRASDGRRRPATCRGSCRRAAAGPGTPPDWPAPGMRLHIGEAAAEQPFGALDRQPLGDIDKFAAAVIAPARDSPRRICWSAPSPCASSTARETMFSLAISSICDCWRRSSPSIAAATSGSAAANGSRPAGRDRRSRRKAGLARNGGPDSRGNRQDSTSYKRGNAHMSAEFAAIYHMSGSNVSVPPEIAVKYPARKAGSRTTENRFRPVQNRPRDQIIQRARRHATSRPGPSARRRVSSSRDGFD